MGSLTLRFGSAQVRVESDDVRPLEALRLMFPEFAAMSPDGSSSDDLLRVKTSDSGRYHLHLPTASPGLADDADALGWPGLVNRMEHVVAERLLWSQSDGIPLHAGGVNLAGSGILVVGPSGAGKSTLSVGLAQAGAPMLGDDVVIVGSDGRALPFPRRPKLDCDQARRMGIDPSSTVLWDAHAEECWLDPSRWFGWSGPVAVGLVLDVMHVPSETTTLAAMTRAETLATIVGAAFREGDEAPSDPLPLPLLDLSTRCSGARLRYSDFTEGIAAIQGFLADTPGAIVPPAV